MTLVVRFREFMSFLFLKLNVTTAVYRGWVWLVFVVRLGRSVQRPMVSQSDLSTHAADWSRRGVTLNVEAFGGNWATPAFYSPALL